MEAELAGAMAQFGVAGLVGAMWLIERRSATARERQVAELHARLMSERREADVVIEALRDNTRALSGVEHGLRSLTGAVERVLWPGLRRGGLGGSDGSGGDGRGIGGAAGGAG